MAGTKRKVCVVITARPSYSRIKTAMDAIKKHPTLELQLVAASSALLNRYGTAADYMENDGFDIHARMFNVLEGENLASMAKTTGLGIIELTTVFDNLRPDMVLTVADRYETMATAIAAAYMNIPLVHVQGGEVTGSIDEKVRHAITKLADIHLVSTAAARDRVIKMGEVPGKVYLTGCPSIDLADEVLKKSALDFDPFQKYGGVGSPLSLEKGYLVVMQHPVTTEYQEARKHIDETLHALKDMAMPVIWFWPNVDAGADGTSGGIRTFREEHRDCPFHFFKNMEPADFLKLLKNSRGLVGNSSVGIRECSYLGIPVVNIGSRQQGRERGHNVVDVDYDRRSIRAAIEKQLSNGHYSTDTLYGDGHAGEKIAETLAQVPLSIKKMLAY